MTTIRADEIEVGDVVDYLGAPHRVSHVDHRAGWAWAVAYDDAGWAMAIGHDLVVVHRADGTPLSLSRPLMSLGG